MKQRVVITGIGVVSPVGSRRDRFWKNLCAGKSGVGLITLFDVSRFPVRIGGQVRDVDVSQIVGQFPAAVRRNRKVLLGLAAGAEASEDARLSEQDLRPAQLYVGVGLEAFFLEDLTRAVGAADMGRELLRMAIHESNRPPLQTPLDQLGQIMGQHYRIVGGRFTNCSACAAGAQAVGEAFRALQRGAAQVAIAGGADSMLNPLGLGGFSLLRVLSTENERPTEACRPFDATRQGTVLGEGAAFLVLETLEHATARGAPAYAEILGYGSSMDAFRVTDPEPSGRGAVLSMRKAIRDAGLTPEAIDCVNAHGTGTPKNDLVETAAIEAALGERAQQVPVHAVKSMTGHLIAASGAVEAAVSALTLHHRTIAPTINLRSRDPECDLDFVCETRAFEGRTVLSNSFGFGGQNATLIFGRISRP